MDKPAPTQQIDIFKTGVATWALQTTDDSVLVVLRDGEISFYRPDDDIEDIS